MLERLVNDIKRVLFCPWCRVNNLRGVNITQKVKFSNNFYNVTFQHQCFNSAQVSSMFKFTGIGKETFENFLKM